VIVRPQKLVTCSVGACFSQEASEPTSKRTFQQAVKLVAKGTPKKPGVGGAGGLLALEDVTRHIMIKKSIHKVLNTIDNEGRTALHLAALMNR